MKPTGHLTQIIGVSVGIVLLTQACQIGTKTSIQPSSAFSAQPSAVGIAQAQSTPQPVPLSFRLETYTSQAMGTERQYGIILPPNYYENVEQRYPVIFLLHGGHGEATDWIDKGKAISTLEKLYASQKLPYSIVITPDGNDRRGSSPYFDPQYYDGPNGKVSTAIGQELVKIIQSRYRTLSTPQFWAIGGLSSGGWGAMNIGLQNLNHFSILFSHSGYFTDASGPQNSPIQLLKKLTPEERANLRLYFDVGQKDEKIYVSQNQQFAQVLKELKVNYQYQPFPGQHSWHYWQEHLSDSLSFVGQQWKNAGIF